MRLGCLTVTRHRDLSMTASNLPRHGSVAAPGVARLVPRLLLALLLGLFSLSALADSFFPAGAPWFNVSRPLTGADLSGRVVLLDFFTPGCINCIHVLPETERLEREFGDRLLVIGVNSPKFSASQHSGNIRGFIARYHIRHPVLTDANMTLWQRYHVFAWPTQILLGPDHQVVDQFIGEGQYASIRRAIIQTLKQARAEHALRLGRLPLKPLPMHRQGLLQPGKVAVSANYVAISDTGHNRILLLDPAGKLLRVIGSGHAGHADGAPGKASFDGPQGLAFAGHALYVADTTNQLIRRIALPSGRVSTVAGNGKQAFGVSGTHPARQVALNSPWGLRRVGDLLYIAMAGDHQVWRLDLHSDRIGPYAGSGVEGLSDGPLDQAAFAQSSGLAYHAGTLFVADPEASAVRAIDLAKGQVKTLIGHGLFDFGLRNGPAAQALLQHDQGLAWLNGKLYIADTFNNAIRVYDPATGKVSTLVSGLAQPGGVAAFGPHTLLVADTNANRMVSVDARNGAIHDWPVKGLNLESSVDRFAR